MENEVKADIIMELATKFNLSLPNAAGVLEFFLDKGWAPETEEDIVAGHEIDLIDRIIHGLPTNAVVVPHHTNEGIADIVFPDGVEIYDVASLHPQVINKWERIPTWDNYEANVELGVIRNRWTKRVLDPVSDGEDNEDYVEMHDKEGFSHFCHVPYIIEQVKNS
ncbi:hypothetical protein SEA_CATERPILLAR_72 [Arthrobacter phage Caterpillar]|nr:hypothetical protein SEA_CATERPILLAR_72 [Arthrobacter phage Caterpillar]